MGEDFEKKDECVCKSKGFRKFLVIALGSFVGVFCALSLFCALHKPPMMIPMPYGQGGYGMTHCNCPCHKIMMKKMMKHHMKAKFKGNENQKPEIDD